MDWIEVKLGTLFNVDVGGDLRKQYFSKTKNEVHQHPIFSNSLDKKGLYGFTSKTRHPANSITITGRGFLGHAEYRDCDFDAIVRLLVLTPKGKVNCRFITYLINSRINFAIESTGVPQLTAPKILKKNAFIPKSVSEQTAIATILSKVDEAIEATQKSIKAANKLKKALMQNLLAGKLKPDGTWRTEDEFWEDEKFGKVPVGWEVKTIRQLFDFHPTASYARSKLIEEGEIGYIHYGDIHTKFHRILDLKTTSTSLIPNELEKKYEKLKDGDLIISDASEDWDGVGKSIEIINSENKKVIAGLHTLHLRPKADELILGIKGYIMNMYQVSVSIKRMATGAKVYGVSKSSLANILLPIPTEQEQQEIKRRLDRVSAEINAKQSKIKTLQRLKKSLMQNLLTGKVRLPEEFIKQFEEKVETKEELV